MTQKEAPTAKRSAHNGAAKMTPAIKDAIPSSEMMTSMTFFTSVLKFSLDTAAMIA